MSRSFLGKLLVVFAALALLAAPTQAASGGGCVACTLIAGLVNQRALELNQTPGTVVKTFCDNSHNPVGKFLCGLFDDAFIAMGLDKVSPKIAPDVLCAKIKLCPTPGAGVCQLFSSWPPTSDRAPSVPAAMTAGFLEEEATLSGDVDFPSIIKGALKDNGVDIPGPDDFWTSLTHLVEFLTTGIKGNIENVFEKHIPMTKDDQDGDYFSTASTMRGSSWRGKDCNDSLSNVHPGRSSSNYGPSVDHNCNGIFGASPNGTDYESMFCANSGRRSVVVVGDSAAAHFRIPPFLLTPSLVFNDSLWDNMLHLVMNGLDWPECSSWTGYQNPENCPVQYVPGPVNSIYQRLRARNRCNHRSFESVAVNGARTSNVKPPTGDIMAFKRDQQNDDPAIVFFALIGNDVCNGHPGMSHMTTPVEFEANVLESLAYLDTQLPHGSHVVFVPLANGTILHETLHNRRHPIGVTYTDFYDYLICEELAPCRGWMSNNATFRAETQKRADELSAIYPKIISEHKYSHFDMYSLPPGDMTKIVHNWIAQGKDPAQLIEPVDGFHPSQTSNALTAEYIWGWIEDNHPEILGPENPFNAEIGILFGDQGGY